MEAMTIGTQPPTDRLNSSILFGEHRTRKTLQTKRESLQVAQTTLQIQLCTDYAESSPLLGVVCVDEIV